MPHRSTPKIVFLIFLVALGLRVVFAFQWAATPYGAAPLLDASLYHATAERIADGHFLRAKAFYQSPLYPYVLALPYALFGPHPLVASLFNALLDAGTCALLAWIGLGLFGPAAGVITGLLAAVNKQMIFATAPVMKESLGLFLLALFLGVSLRNLRGPTLKGFAWTGFLLGLGMLTRGNVVFLAPFALFPLFLKGTEARFKKAALFGACFLLALLPATLHNAVVSRSFVPINYTDGFNLYLGHFDGADGITYIFPEGIASGPDQEEHDTTWLAAQGAGRSVSPAEVSRYWRGRAFDEIVAHPAHEITLFGNKLFGLWNNGETFDNYDLPFIEKNYPTLLNASLLGFWSLAFLAPMGALLWARRKKREISLLVGFAASYAVSLVLFYVTERYRQPMIVFLLPLAGGALPALVLAARHMRIGTVFAALLLGAASVGFSLWPRPPAKDLAAYDWGMLAMIFEAQGRSTEALQAAQKAITLSPTEAGTTSYVKGSLALEKLGRQEEAERLLRLGIGFFPTDGMILYELGRIQAARGDIRAAAESFGKAMELNPAYLLALSGRARALAHLGDLAEARKVALQGLALDPTNGELRAALAAIQQREKREE